MTEREQIEMDVVFVGAGPANLAGALWLKQKAAEHDEFIEKGIKQGEKLGELEIAIVEKGSFVGAHILSGAVMDPIAIRELMPDFLDQGCPVDTVVTEDAAWYLTEKKAINAPIVPPPLKNKGKYILSLSKMCEWLGREMRRGRHQHLSGVSRRRHHLRRERPRARHSHGRQGHRQGRQS
jgi:electron-transferring-flavoprotein dehydrogenase